MNRRPIIVVECIRQAHASGLVKQDENAIAHPAKWMYGCLRDRRAALIWRHPRRREQGITFQLKRNYLRNVNYRCTALLILLGEVDSTSGKTHLDAAVAFCQYRGPGSMRETWMKSFINRTCR
jgi:hypothetical protein